MNELVAALPSEVVDFVEECRRDRYAPGSTANKYTGNPYEFCFEFHRPDMYYNCTETLQSGISVGTEYVARKGLPPHAGCKYYQCQYAGSKTQAGEDLGEVVDQTLHRLIVENPTLVQFGTPKVLLWSEIGGAEVRYQEFRIDYPWGFLGQVRLEILEDIKPLEIFKGAYLITNFTRS